MKKLLKKTKTKFSLKTKFSADEIFGRQNIQQTKCSEILSESFAFGTVPFILQFYTFTGFDRVP